MYINKSFIEIEDNMYNKRYAGLETWPDVA